MKRPLVRQALTITAPWSDDRGAAPTVTVEVVILSRGHPVELDGPDPMATPDDLPELRQAGWLNHATGDLDVFVRTIEGTRSTAS